MPDPGALSPAGLFGKLPAHGDFVRRGLPGSFCGPWDDWLRAGMAAARDALGDGWDTAWDSAPAWRFALPAGACGPTAVAGVMLPSRDAVGRHFPLTLAAFCPAEGPAPWPPGWFAALEGAGRAARDGGLDAGALAALLPAPVPEAAPPPDAGWWTAGAPGLVWPLPALPPADQFVLLLEPPA